MKQLSVDTEADEELVSAAAHYEAEREGLGLAFIDAVEAAYVRIVERPNAWALVADGHTP